MDKGNNVTQTFVGDVKTTFVENNESNNVPNYFWTNDDEKTILDYQLNLKKDNYKAGTYDGNNLDKHQETIVTNKTVIDNPMRKIIENIFDENEFEEYDIVNKPKHYNSEVFPQAIDMMLQLFSKNDVLAFCKLNAFKYRMRCGLKNSDKIVEDIEKAMWYENKYKELNTNSSDEKQILKG